MSWYDWGTQSPSSYVSFFHNFTSWITWIIIAIVIIVIFWIVWGGGNHDFVGFKPLVPGVKPSDVMDQDTMTILGIRDPIASSGTISPSTSDELGYNSSKIESPPFSDDDEEEIFTDLSQLTPGVDGPTPFYEDAPLSVRMVSSRQIRENRLNSNLAIYLPSPDRPPTGRTPKFKDLDLGTAQERRSAAESRGERISREFLEKYYQMKFPRIRPDFLINPVSGRNLELDGYNSELNMAFEYNGYQHYTYPNRFHKTEEEFSQQIRRDGYKQEACRLAGVYLIIIPYTVPHAHIPQFINGRLPHRVHLLRSSQR